MVKLPDLQFEYTDINTNIVYRVTPSDIEVTHYNIESEPTSMLFRIVIYDTKYNYYALTMEYEYTNIQDFENGQYDVQWAAIKDTNDEYIHFIMNACGSYTDPDAPNEKDVYILLKKFAEYKHIDLNRFIGNKEKEDETKKPETLLNFKKLPEKTKAKILDEIGSLIDDVVYQQGYNDGINETKNIPKENIIKMVEEIKNTSDTIHLIDRDVDYITLDILFEIITKYCN